ncbi:MAG: hypothetical protein HY791_10450 [Deltaproteobacteria bacterium]|nr:hypothetical protein [Deltaproteobacteria bacterium]
MSSLDLIEVVDASYRLDVDDRSWLRGIAGAVKPFLDRGFGLMAYAYDRRDPVARRRPTLELLDCPSGAEQIMSAQFPRTDIDAVFGDPRPVSTLSEALGSTALARRSDFVELMRTFGIADVLGIHASSPDGRGVIIGCPLPKITGAFEVERWSRVSAHIAAGHRLRDEYRAGGSECEFVIDEAGRIEHAPEGASEPIRAAISSAAVALRRARGPLRRVSPDEALGVWRALVLGRWSILSEVEFGGRRFMVARRNEPTTSGSALDALTLRERQVLGFACLGHGNKLVAYELGLSVSTVATHLRKAGQKLGFPTRSALIRGVLDGRSTVRGLEPSTLGGKRE